MTLIDDPIKDENCEITMSSLLSIQVCSKLSEEDTLAWLQRVSPSGTTANWQLQDKTRDDYLAPVQCADDPNKTHFIFVC